MLGTRTLFSKQSTPSKQSTLSKRACLPKPSAGTLVSLLFGVCLHSSPLHAREPAAEAMQQAHTPSAPAEITAQAAVARHSTPHTGTGQGGLPRSVWFGLVAGMFLLLAGAASTRARRKKHSRFPASR